MASLEGMRDKNGKLVSFSWPGGYPVYYLDNENQVLCPDCANEQEEENKQPDAIVVFTIVACGINEEDPDLYCDQCSKFIESAYAEPDKESN